MAATEMGLALSGRCVWVGRTGYQPDRRHEPGVREPPESLDLHVGKLDRGTDIENEPDDAVVARRCVLHCAHVTFDDHEVLLLMWWSGLLH